MNEPMAGTSSDFSKELIALLDNYGLPTHDLHAFEWVMGGSGAFSAYAWVARRDQDGLLVFESDPYSGEPLPFPEENHCLLKNGRFVQIPS